MQPQVRVLNHDTLQKCVFVFKNSKMCLYLNEQVVCFLQVNLCFDQFVYKLADQIFGYYKVMAGR